MIQISSLDNKLIDKITSRIGRDHLDFFEYRFLTDSQLKQYLKESLQKKSNIGSSNNCLVAIENGTPLGIIIINKNSFDSSFFGFDCYQFNIQVFCSIEKVKKISDILITESERLCKTKSNHFYVYISLNNNFLNNQITFNSLTENNYYFISTLLTFSLQNNQEFKTINHSNEIKIRTVNSSDVDQVSMLAEKSFKFSRFHMDPFLNNLKANELLKTSARNSILNNYVDIMFIAEINDMVVGYYSGKKKYVPEFDKTFGTAVISAVDSNYRGKGIFNLLDNNLLNWFSDNCDFAEMGTYLINYPVHKTWINKKLGLIRGTYQFSKYINII